ncbi:hypothetical protein ANN_11317 [Periplaneta americana]|uniref:Uncharacterized protein n=1 Tax=Periplaneta americana TaxID=6978 RepID=A0ABQ8T4P4_PERAM|nr:hypothetical protein ANN_11317 [Periplaneta americana]
MDAAAVLTLPHNANEDKDGYSCETWTFTLREEQGLRVFENEVLKKIFEAKRNEVTGEWRKLHNAELHTLYSLPNIIKTFEVSEKVKTHICIIWARENPHVSYELERSSPKVNVWCGVSRSEAYGPFFFAEKTIVWILLGYVGVVSVATTVGKKQYEHCIPAG